MALVTGTLLGVLWLSDAPVIGEVPTGLPGLAWEMPAAAFLVTALQPALILALLGSVDSLLTSLVADSLTGRKHNPDRGMVGQGIGNMVAGLFGSLPGAGATMGTVINIRSGGSTRVSGALRALLVLAVVLGLGRSPSPSRWPPSRACWRRSAGTSWTAGCCSASTACVPNTWW